MRRSITRRWKLVLALAAIGVAGVITPVLASKVTTTDLKARSNATFMKSVTGQQVIPPGNGSPTDPSARLAEIKLTKGNYIVIAKLDIQHADLNTNPIQCYLTAGNDSDYAETFDDASSDELVLQAAARLTSGGTVDVSCGQGNKIDDTYSNLRISAIEVPKLTVLTG